LKVKSSAAEKQTMTTAQATNGLTRTHESVDKGIKRTTGQRTCKLLTNKY